MKPHEETWEYDGDHIVMRGTDHRLLWPGDSERAKLAAAAPEMATLLRDMEWSGDDERAGYYCPSCNGLQLKGHRSDCRLEACLRKAGLR